MTISVHRKKKIFINCSYTGRVVVVSEENPLLLTSNKINVSAVTKIIFQSLFWNKKQSCTHFMMRTFYELITLQQFFMLLWHHLNDELILTAKYKRNIHVFWESVVEKIESHVSMLPIYRYIWDQFYFHYSKN